MHTQYVFLNDLTEFYELLQITTNYQKFLQSEVCLSSIVNFLFVVVLLERGGGGEGVIELSKI